MFFVLSDSSLVGIYLEACLNISMIYLIAIKYIKHPFMFYMHAKHKTILLHVNGVKCNFTLWS